MADGYNICTDLNYVCPGIVNRDVEWGGHSSISHSRHSQTTITVDGVSILKQKIDREFSIEYHENVVWTGTARVVIGEESTPYFCEESVTGDWGSSIRENITWLDTEILYLDHVKGIMFWREQTQTCTFATPNQKTALFRSQWGSFYSYWMMVSPERQTTTRWKLLVGKKIIELHTVVGPSITPGAPQYNILFPLPPSNVTPVDQPVRSPESFYDYYTDIELQNADGGQDWYYPDWMRDVMGIDRSELVADALVRYEWWYNSKQPLTPTETFTLPDLPPAFPSGNATVDKFGNILVSFQCGDVYVNKLFLKGGNVVDITADKLKLITGDNLRLYPVSIF